MLQMRVTSFEYVPFYLQVVNKGLTSYKDPESGPGRGQKTLHVTGDMDLTKVNTHTSHNKNA